MCRAEVSLMQVSCLSDKLISVNGKDMIIEDYHIKLTEESVSVYNFQVEDFHTYYVGKNGV